MADRIIHSAGKVQAVQETPAQKTAREGTLISTAPPTSADVNAERDRRILVGKDISVTGYANPIAVSGDDTTQTNLMALSLAAQARIGQGDTATLTPYRDESNAIHQLTPPQMFELWSLGATFVSLVYQSSWVLKDDANGIPADYKDDYHWPA